ncbi:TPA: hypothetical protein ACJ56S_004868 [Klebsiella pneumoniae]
MKKAWAACLATSPALLFWVVTRYLGLSVPDGLKTWTVLTTIMGVTGFLITWLLWFAL